MAVTSNWNLLGNTFYRKLEVFSLEWPEESEFNKFQIVPAPFAGPIALLYKPPQSAKPLIFIFTSAGKEIGFIKWNSGVILKLGWSNHEELLALQEDGRLLIYNLEGNYDKSISMGKDASELKIKDGQIFTTPAGTTGLVVMTINHRFYLVTSIHEPKIRQLTDIPGYDIPPSCWCVLNNSLTPQLLVAKQSDLYFLKLTDISEKQKIEIMKEEGRLAEFKSIVSFALSYDNKFLACLTNNGYLWIGSSNLKEMYSYHDTGFTKKPSQFVWCGNGAVLLVWDFTIFVYGSGKNDIITYDYYGNVHLIMEKDAVRIISSSSHEIFQKVPRELSEIFKIGSVSSGAMLFEASRLFHEGKKECNEYIKLVKEKLKEGIDFCCLATLQEFDPQVQKQLLRATSFGICLLDEPFDNNKLLSTAKNLRLLNQLRSRSIGLPFTWNQLELLTIEVLLNRLILRKLYWLTFEISKDLNIGVENVIISWAREKIRQSNLDDSSLCSLLTNKMRECPNISYNDIINEAISKNKIDLALKLIDQEPRIYEQIPLLLKLNLENKALQKAILAGDSDLIYLVLFQWKSKLSHGEFLRSIRVFPTALNLYKKYCRQENPSLLLDIYYQEDDHEDEAVCRVINSYQQERFDKRISTLLVAREAFQRARQDLYARLVEDQVKLLKFQKKMEEEMNDSFLDKSVDETLSKLIILDSNNKYIDLIKKEFKVSDKKFWWIKIEALSLEGMWEELERFSKVKKSPIGYEPFLECCVRHNNIELGKSFISKVTNFHLVRCHLLLGDLETASNIAIQNKNEEEIIIIMKKCSINNDKIIYNKLNNFLNQHKK